MTVYSAASSTSRKKKDTIGTASSSGNANNSRVIMEANSSSLKQNQYFRSNNNNNGRQQPQPRKGGEQEGVVSEQAPLLPRRTSPPIPPLPPRSNPPMKLNRSNSPPIHIGNNGNRNNNNHNNSQQQEKTHHSRTRSVDASGAFVGLHEPLRVDASPTTAALRKTAPGRDHHRTRSLEEWASLFGIEGISIKDQELEKTRERELYRNRNQRALQRTENLKKGHKPPLPRKPFVYCSPSTKNRKVFLDSIVEAEAQHDENDSGENNNQIGGTDTASFSAAATEDNNSSVTVIPKLGSTFDDNQSVGSNGSSTIFSIPQHLINGTGHSSMDDSSVDDSSTGTGSWTDQYTHSRRNSHDFATTERLAKFERDQEMLFQKKKMDMERELSNVLERNTVKSHREKQEFINTYMLELEKERAKLITQWRQEWEKEEDYLRQRDPKRKLLRNFYNKIGLVLDSLMFFFSSAEVFISNMPLTIAALALSWASMGCVWFKFMEENVDSCHHVHFYSPQCTFPEFPGCFECDMENRWFIIGLHWHYLCSAVSFIFCSMIMLKVIIAWDVVVDELGNPTTSTPCGVFCIAMVVVFAGRGPVGEVVVIITATFHFILAFWFLYMAMYRYRLYPDPGWFPNTVGISYAAVKSFLYFPVYGEMLMSFCLIFFVGVFFISGIRVATNPKIAAPICWFMLSAPSITLYSVTLISQPLESEEAAMAENPELKEHFLHFLHRYYVPLHHFLFACSIAGVCSGIHGVSSRWKKFKEKPFSPAHVAFCAPTLSHTNAIQSYRATILGLTSFAHGGWFCRAIYIYWCIFLFIGTTVNLIFTYKFLRRLPEWTKVDVSGEDAPPEPYETMTHEMLDDRGAHESMFQQSFVSPAVLEANEAGALIRVRRGTEDYRLYGPYIRTRKVTARGFDPSMNDAELREERAALLDWVAKNAPRKRNRTMSIPGVMHLRDKDGRGVYGTMMGGLVGSTDANGNLDETGRIKHSRSKTSIDGFW